MRPLVLFLLAAFPLAARAADPVATDTTLAEAVAPSAGPHLADQPAEVRVRPRVMPADGPISAEAFAGRAHVVCLVRVSIDKRGVPYEVTPVTCDEPFFALGIEISMRTRFYPVKDAGKRVKARFDYAIQFKNPHLVTAAGEQGPVPP